MGHVSLRGRLHSSRAIGGCHGRGFPHRIQNERQTDTNAAGISSSALHTTPLRVEERQMADTDRVSLRVPRWILGGILLPRTWKYLERRTFQRPERQARP